MPLQNLETKVVVNTLRRLIPHGKGMVKRLDNQPRMEDVFATNSRVDLGGKFIDSKRQRKHSQ